MFGKLDYISVWVRFVLNSSCNCFLHSGKVCMVPCINFIACFIWCCFSPTSMEAAFLFFYSFCVVSAAVFWSDNLVGMEIIVTWWEFVTLQNTLFSFHSFFRISISFYNASFLLLLVCFAASTSVGVFLLSPWLWRTFKIEFLTELFCSFSARFCLLNLRRRFALLLLFNTAVYDSLLCLFVLASVWIISPFSSEGVWFYV